MSEPLNQIKQLIEKRKLDGQVIQLNFQGIKFEKFTPEIRAAVQEVRKLEVLILIGCGLTTLENFPNINLHAVDLSDNKLDDDSHLEVFVGKTNLTQFFATGNKISNLETILQLKSLPNLIQVDFMGNPVTDQANYRDQIFKNFKEIAVVDRKDKDGKQVEQEDEFDENEFDDDDSEEYDAQEDSDQFDDDEDFEEESEEKPKRGRKRKN